MRPTTHLDDVESSLPWSTDAIDSPADHVGLPPVREVDRGLSAYPWTLGLLHSFRVEQHGQVVHRFQRRILDSLLAYLALYPTRAHGRDEIARQFWPERPLNLALRRLSHVLFTLTRQLKDLGLPDGIVVADYYTLRLAPEIETDIQRLDAMLSRAQRETDPVERRRILDHALGVYGDGVLPMMSYPWVRPEQERLSERICRLRESLQREEDPQRSVGNRHEPVAAALPREDVTSSVQSPGTRAAGSVQAIDGMGGGADDQEEDERAAKARALVIWLERLEPHLLGPDRARWVQQVSDREPEVQLTTEWAVSEGGSRRDPSLALRLVAALWRYWYLRSMVQQGRRFAEQVLLTRPAIESLDYARAVYAAGSLALCSSDQAFAKAWFEESLQLAVALDDKRLQSRCLASLGVVAYQESDLHLARQLLAEGSAAFRAAGDQVLLAGALHNAALVEIDSADFERAEVLLRECMDLGQRLGDQTIVANGLVTLGTVAGHIGSWEKVVPLVARAQALFESQGDLSGVVLCLRYRAFIAAERGEIETAQVYVECSLSLCRTMDDLPGISESLRLLAEIYEQQGRVAEALALYRDALQPIRQTRPRPVVTLAAPVGDAAREPSVAV